MPDSRSEPINFYNILMSDRHDLTLSSIIYLLSDRRSDANTILLIYRVLQGNLTSHALQSSEVAVDWQEPMVLQH